MKKKYVKPDLIVEQFLLAQSIAACDYKLNYSDGNNCFVPVGSGAANYAPDAIFMKGVVSGCNVTPEGYCYFNGSGTMYSTHTS